MIHFPSVKLIDGKLTILTLKFKLSNFIYKALRLTKIPGPGVLRRLSLLLVLVLAPTVFLRVLRFSSLHKNQYFKIPIRSGIRGPRVCQSYDCYV